jgi:hypothetical protein
MAVNSELNWLGQQRVDLPHLRMIESGVRYDFDSLAYMLVGETPQIVRGFELITGSVGLEATKIVIKTAGSKVIHNLASDSGSIFAVPYSRDNETLDPTTNTRMVGSCSPNSTNYIGIDLKKSADPSTADLAQFIVPLENIEDGQKVPLRRTMDYVFIIRQVDFSLDKSICPLLIVTTNNKNVITSIKDVRPLLGRLATGGANNSDIAVYGWPGGRPNNESTDTSVIAGDKSLRDLKSWMNAIMHRLHELGGGQYWYSIAADRNVHLHTGGSLFNSTGESFEVVGGNIHWQGLSFSFDNSPQYKLTIADQTTNQPGLTNLIDGECLYCDINRTVTSSVVLQKGSLSTLGGSLRPGQRWVVVSRIGSNYYVNGVPYPIGAAFSLATTSHSGNSKISIDAVTTLNPVAVGFNTNASTGYGVATCTGISHNLDVGAAHTKSTPGDLYIGRGTAAGDQNLFIKSEGNKSVWVSGTGSKGYPYLATRTGGGTPFSSAAVDCTPLDLQNQCQFEGTNSWSQKVITVLPLPPSGGPGSSSPAVKWFMKRYKTFLESVRVMAGLIGEWTYNDTTKTITRTDTNALVVDSVTVSLNDRILVNQSGFSANGPYYVTNLGGGSDHAEMTRAFDAGGLNGIQNLGLGYDIFDGVSVKVLQGTSYSNTFWTINSLPKAGDIKLDGTQIKQWQQSDDTTCEQLCVMFYDGSYTVVVSGPTYSIGL